MTPLAKLRKVSYLAKKADRPYRSLLRQLLAVLKQDTDRGERAWMFKIVVGGHWAVNESELRRLHPEIFERRYVSREEYDDLETRVSTVEKVAREEKKHLRAMSVRTSQTEKRVLRLETQLNLLPA